MTKAFKCDACGTLFESKGTGSSYGADLSGIGLMSSLRVGWYPDSIDICPQYVTPLREFLWHWWNNLIPPPKPVCDKCDFATGHAVYCPNYLE